MIEASIPDSQIVSSLRRLFVGLVECTACSERRTVEIGSAEYRVLRRQGTARFDCQVCKRPRAHRWIRIVS